MTDKKELNNEELEQITGGWQQDTSCIREGGVGAHLCAQDARSYIGRRVYVISDRSNVEYCYGTLTNSWTDTSGCDDVIVHSVNVEHSNYWGSMRDKDGYLIKTGPYNFSSEDVTLYLKEN